MRRIILGVAIAGVSASVALAVRSQLAEQERLTSAPSAAAVQEVRAPAPGAPAQTADPAPPQQQPQAQKPPKVIRNPHPPIIENAENFQVPSAADILTRASNAYKSAQSLSADFTLKRQNPLLDSNTTSSGKMYQKRPDRFLLKFMQPAGDVIVADGRYFWVYYPSADRRQVLRAPAAQGAGGVDLQAQFLGDPLHRFTYTFAGSEAVRGRKAYVLDLVPKTNAGYKSLKVWIDAQDHLARRFIVTESNGVVQEFTLANLKLNPTLSNDLFRFTPPADAHIVERP